MFSSKGRFRLSRCLLCAICLLPDWHCVVAAQDRRLIIKSGQEMKVADLTLVSYEHALQLVDEVARKSPVAEFRSTGATFTPAVDSWDPKDEQASLQEFYHHVLKGAVGQLVISDVYDIVAKAFPLEHRSGYDVSGLERYSIAFRENESVRRRFLLAAYADSKTPADFASILLRRSPHFKQLNLDPNDPAMQASCGYDHQIYIRLVDSCFPIARDGKVAPWTRGCVVAGLIHFHLVADIQRRPNYYDAAYTRYHGLPTVALLRCPEEIPPPVVGQIGNTLIARDGQVAQRGIRELRETMSRLGGELTIEVDQMLIESLHELIGTKSGDAVVGRVHHDKQARAHQYLYVGAQTLNTEQVRTIREPSFRQPGSPFYDVAREITLLPIVRNALETIRPEPGFELPSETWLTMLCGNSAVDKRDFWGNPLPQLERP